MGRRRSVFGCIMLLREPRTETFEKAEIFRTKMKRCVSPQSIAFAKCEASVFGERYLFPDAATRAAPRPGQPGEPARFRHPSASGLAGLTF
eukprot:COSAG06_NODE_3046_length_5921_cov_23.094813_1_plen_91_part_00